MLLWYARTCIFAIYVQTISIVANLFLVTYLYVPLLGVLNGIGNKVCYYLLYAPVVNRSDKCGVGAL